jgi:Kef-type K+ transport system membrane component KefB
MILMCLGGVAFWYLLVVPRFKNTKIHKETLGLVFNVSIALTAISWMGYFFNPSLFEHYALLTTQSTAMLVFIFFIIIAARETDKN